MADTPGASARPDFAALYRADDEDRPVAIDADPRTALAVEAVLWPNAVRWPN